MEFVFQMLIFSMKNTVFSCFYVKNNINNIGDCVGASGTSTYDHWTSKTPHGR